MKPHILLKAGSENVACAETEKYIHQVWNKINAVVVKSFFDGFADSHHSDHENFEFDCAEDEGCHAADFPAVFF